MYAAKDGSSTRRQPTAVGGFDEFSVNPSVFKPLCAAGSDSRCAVERFFDSATTETTIRVILLGFTVPRQPGRADLATVYFGVWCVESGSWVLGSTPLTKTAKNIFMGASSDKLPVPSRMSVAQ
jgi:hypothetical protein